MEAEDSVMDNIDYVRHIDLENRDTEINRDIGITRDNEMNNVVSKNSSKSSLGLIIKLFWCLVSLFALYLSFKCNNGFNLQGFLGASFFGPIYVAYKLGSHWDKCFPKKI